MADKPGNGKPPLEEPKIIVKPEPADGTSHSDPYVEKVKKSVEKDVREAVEKAKPGGRKAQREAQREAGEKAASQISEKKVRKIDIIVDDHKTEHEVKEGRPAKPPPKK